MCVSGEILVPQEQQVRTHKIDLKEEEGHTWRGLSEDSPTCVGYLMPSKKLTSTLNRVCKHWNMYTHTLTHSLTHSATHTHIHTLTLTHTHT